MIDLIVKHLPRDTKHFVDVCGVYPTVALNVPKHPLMTYNDMSGEVVNFFRVLRDSGDEFMERLTLPEGERTGNLSEVDRAHAFYTHIVRSPLSGGSRWTVENLLQAKKHIPSWMFNTEGLAEIIIRLKLMQIESKPALDIIKRYDHEQTVFYLDMSLVKDHKELEEVLGGVKGKVILSGLRDKGTFRNWKRIDGAESGESIWINFSKSSNEHGLDFS